MKLNEKVSLAILTSTLLPVFASAKDCGYVPGTGALKPCGTTGLTTIGDIVLRITWWFLGFAGAVAVLFIIFGGLKYVTAAGNEKQTESAKATLTAAVIGIIIILLSGVIVTLVANSIDSVAGTATPIISSVK
jgi:heme/copper-type cytochrome/quinol oxidase subunit 2